MGLDVGPKPNATCVHGGLPLANVLLQTIQVDQSDRCIEIVNGESHLGLQRVHSTFSPSNLIVHRISSYHVARHTSCDSAYSNHRARQYPSASAPGACVRSAGRWR